jgi:hypothetical protein
MPRWPSIEAISAVSSPHTKAPAPRLIDARVLDRERVFHADVDVAVLRADREGPDQHSLDHAVRVPLQHAAIHVGAGVSLVGVADDVLGMAGGLAAELPLAPGREARAAPTAQAGLLYLLDDTFRSSLEDRSQGGVAADGDVVLDLPRVHQPVLGEDLTVLLLVEGNVALEGEALPVARVPVEQPLDGLLLLERLLQDLRCVFGADAGVEDPLGIDHHQGLDLAEAVAAGLAEEHLSLQLPLGDLSPEGLGHLPGAAGHPAGPPADGDAGALGRSAALVRNLPGRALELRYARIHLRAHERPSSTASTRCGVISP